MAILKYRNPNKGEGQPEWVNVFAYSNRELVIKDVNTALLDKVDKEYVDNITENLVDAVNEFTINGVSVWLDKNTRNGLKLRFETELAFGKTETTLWYNKQSFKLPLEKAVLMLYAIELYASECYDVTLKHLSNIDSLETLEDILNYDYRAGYPAKLNF